MRDDIVDLAGVRIALYFPADRNKVSRLLHESFDFVAAPRHFPDKGKPPLEGKRFDGYHASHFRVCLPLRSLPEAQKRFANAPVEVQLGSVLMHAWAEVEHDLVYKPASGELSVDEYAILDELNGLVIAGEIALERLQRAVETRVTRQNAVFTNEYELGAFLYEGTKGIRSDAETEPPMGRVALLLDLLRSAELDTPEGVRRYVDLVKDVTEDRPIAEQITDALLAEKPPLFNRYVELQSRYRERQPASTLRAFHQAIGSFVSRWTTIERMLSLLSDRGPFQSPGILLRQLGKNEQLPAPLAQRLRHLWQLRNHIVHGAARASIQELKQAGEELDDILATIEATGDPRLRDALREARGVEELVATTVSDPKLDRSALKASFTGSLQ